LIVPRFGISKRRRLPVLKLLDHSISPFSGLSVIRQFCKWSLSGVPGSDLVQVSTPLDKLVMSRDRAGMMLYEWGTWTKYYVPRGFDFAGKTVLDVGAGEGETVELYRLHGAKKFICVEVDPARAARLRENAAKNGWDAEVVEEPFSLRFLDQKFDFLKMDCEGCEAALLGTKVSFPSVLETHGAATTEGFLKMGGFRTLRFAGNTALVSNVAPR
jgi:methyltransferase family protein